MKIYSNLIRIISLFLTFLLISCDELEVDEGSIYEASVSDQIPDINNLVVDIDGSSVSFTWLGNEFAHDFSYKLVAENLSGMPDADHLIEQPYYQWSEWTDITSISIFDLDEGDYYFYVKSRFDQIEAVEPFQSGIININNIAGPALRIYPLHQTAQPGDTIDVYLYFEEVSVDENVAGMDVNINIDQNGLEFIPNSHVLGSLIADILNNTGISAWPIETGIIDDQMSMSVTGIAYNNNDGVGLYGTGPLVQFSLKIKETAVANNTYNINVGQGEFYNINGEPKAFLVPVDGSVTVEEEVTL